MSTTSQDNGPCGDGPFTSYHMSGDASGISLSIGAILLILTITFASCFPDPTHPDDTIIVVEAEGLDEESIKSYPKIQFSKSNKGNDHNGSTCSCCSICLADYEEDDLLRLLPDCNHMFHVKCVDPWLRLHPTCPICRRSPRPTPFA